MPPPKSKRAVHRIGVVLVATMLIGLSLFFIVHADSSSHIHFISSSPHGQPQDERLKFILGSSRISDFDDWVKKIRPLNSFDNAEIEKGRVLALNRRQLFKELMSLSPKSALDHAVPNEVYRRIPASIKTHLETPVNAYGDFKVYVVMLHQNHHSPEMMTGLRIEREVTIGTSKYRALVYGRRESITTKLNIPLQGVILDGTMVVDEAPVSRVDPSQYQLLNVDRAKALAGGAVAEIGGKLVYFSAPAELETFVRDQIKWEETIGPVRADSGESLSQWTTGVKTVLFIRVDFPDRPGEPVDFANQPLTVTRAQNLINNEVSPFYVSNSLNKTSLQTTVTPVVRMPQPQPFYFNNTGALFNDAENAARAAGFDPNNFNLDLIAMTGANFDYSGIANVGFRGAVLNGVFNLTVTAHELGHNYGLWHANLWETTDGSIIGSGHNLEYGNPFDVMGSGSDSRAHFSAPYKRRLDWITDANVKVIDQDGVYRVFAHDLDTIGEIRALKVRKNSDKNYWIEFRQLFTDRPTIMNGAIINWDYRSRNFTEIQILDTVPPTPTIPGMDTVIDAPLQIGSVFNDNEDRIRISVLGKGNTTPESLDIKVELNVGCTFSLNQTSQTFTASGGEGIVPLSTLTGCKVSVTSDSSWLQSVTGDSTPVRYVVAANYDSSPRTGTIAIAGQTFTVQQAAAVTPCAPPPPPDLVAWWRGEGNALDQTGKNNGALVNNPKFAGGKVGGGFLGDPQNAGGYVEVSDSQSLTLTRSMAIEGWVKLNSANGIVLRRTRDFSPASSAYDFSVSSSLVFAVYNDNQVAAVFGDPLPLGEFTHIAATLDDDSGRMSLYVNGNLVKQITTSVRPNVAPGATVKIGDVDGVTDELSVYNRALSGSEILAIYNAGNASTGAAGKCLVPSTLIQLLLDPTPSSNNRVIALDSVLFIRDPLPIVNPANLLNGPDRNTRVLIFVKNLRLEPGELPSAVVVSMFDPLTNQTHNIPAENVWGVNVDFSQVTFRLPDDISPGLINMTVKFHGQVSNVGRIRLLP